MHEILCSGTNIIACIVLMAKMKLLVLYTGQEGEEIDGIDYSDYHL